MGPQPGREATAPGRHVGESDGDTCCGGEAAGSRHHYSALASQRRLGSTVHGEDRGTAQTLSGSLSAPGQAEGWWRDEWGLADGAGGRPPGAIAGAVRQEWFAGFAEHEIVELLLTLAIPRSDVKEPAKALLQRFGSVRGVLDAPPEALRQVAGIGSVAPVALAIIRAAAVLYLQQVNERASVLDDRARIRDFWRLRIGSLPNEVFEVAYLDSGLRLVRNGVERLQQGTVDRASVYPRQVVEAALRRGAAAIVLAHNHPNGRVEPSEADKLTTRAIVLAAETIRLRVVDHLIVSPDDAFSFREAGLL